jgi:hypothetical protein
MLAGLCLGAVGCFATPPEVAVQRASKEFACPSEKITVVQRADITESLYDVNVCGQRARYACINTGGRDGYPGSVGIAVGIGGVAAAVALAAVPYDDGAPAECIREPDPARWDPDPILIASLPGPPGSATGGPQNGKVRRICGDSGYGDCLYRDNGAWRWRPPQTPSCPGSAVGLTCQ